jgi:hypothetical protein
MQACVVTNKKPLSKQKKKTLKRNMSAVTHAPIPKKLNPDKSGFYFDLPSSALH